MPQDNHRHRRALARRPPPWGALLVAIGAVILGVALVGCGSSTSQSGTVTVANNASSAHHKGGRYVMVTFLSGIQFWKPAYRGMQDAASGLGATAQYQGTPNYSAQDEVTTLQQLAATHPTGILVTAQNPDALKGPVQSLIQQGIPVVMFDSDSPDSGRPAYVHISNEQLGSQAADIMAKAIGGSGQVAVITTPGQLNLDQREAGFKQELAAKHPGIQVVAVANALTDYTTSAAAASQFLQAHPALKGIFSTGSSGGPGSATALKEVGKTGKVAIVSSDIDAATIQDIKSGEILATMVQDAYCEGYWGMEELYALASHSAVPDPPGVAPLPYDTTCGTYAATKSNINQFTGS